MTAANAKEVSNWLGWLLLGASITQVPALLAGTMLSGLGVNSSLLVVSATLFILALATAVALILKTRAGFYLLYAVTLLGFVGPRINFVPFVTRVLPPGPEMEYYLTALNIAVAAIAAWCHWSILHDDPNAPAPQWQRSLVLGFVILLVPGLIYWKTGLMTFNADIPKLTNVPLIGPELAGLDSGGPASLRGQTSPRKNSGMLVISAPANLTNIQNFAVTHGLKLMTNAEARVKFLPLARAWKLDPKRFPVFTNATDLCYVGRLPGHTKMAFQLCYSPGEQHFTALSMGSLETRQPTAKIKIESN